MSRPLGAGSTRVHFERVCASLDGPMGDGILEAGGAERNYAMIGTAKLDGLDLLGAAAKFVVSLLTPGLAGAVCYVPVN